MTVYSFDSFEAMQAHMMRAEAAANAKVTDAQKAIKPGDYVQQIVRTPGVSPDFVVIGKTFSIEERVALEMAYSSTDDPVDEDYERRNYAESIERGYLYGWWSSAWESGEFGSVHRYNMMRTITEEEYLATMAEIGGQIHRTP